MINWKVTNWRAIAQATIVTVFASALIGGAWGLFGVFLFLNDGMENDESVQSPTAYIMGILVSMLPIVLGTWFLIGLVYHNQRQHCLLLGIVFTGVSLGFGFSERSFAWHDIFYYFAIVPTTLMTYQLSQVKQRVR